MKTFLSGVPVFAAGMLLGGSLQAQELIPGTYNPWTASGSAAPARSTAPLQITLLPSVSNASGSNTAGPWSLSATGIIQARVGTPAVPPLVPEITLLDIGTRAQTTVNAGSQSLSFDLDSWADVGALDLDGLLGTGVVLGWQADLTFANFDWDIAPTYELNFDFSTPAGFLSDFADVAGALRVSVRDGDDNLVHSVGGAELLDLLGVLDITSGTAVGNGTISFSGAGAQTDGLTMRFEAVSLVNTSLLGSGSNVATFSNISFTAVPEPGVPMLAGLAVLTLAGRRRRDRI